MSDAPKPTLVQSELAPSFDLKIGDKTQTVVMTFGRLNRLCKLIGNMNDVGRMIEEPEIAEQMLVQLLSTKKNQIDIDELEITPEEVSKILAWAGTHILDFFIKLGSNFNESSEPLMEGMLATVDKMGEKTRNLQEVQTSLTTGSVS